MRRSDLRIRIASGLLVLLCASAWAQVIVRPIDAPGGGKGSDLIVVSFHGGGFTDRQGLGLGVFTPQGQPVPFKALAHDPEGQTTLGIDARGASLPLQLRYSLQPIPNAKRDAGLQPSLLLQVFPSSRKDYKDAADLSKALAGVPPRGTMLVSQIDLAYNPFGASEHFASVFEGVLRLDAPRALKLFSVHHAMAFVEIDGKPIITAPKPLMTHSSEKLDELAVPLTLDKGTHKVRYLHAQTEGRPMALLGYIDENKRALPLPASMFVHDRPGTLGDGTLDKGAGTALGFDVQPIDQAAFDQWTFARMRFRPIAPPPAGQTRYRWDFGDGVTLIQGTPEGDARKPPPREVEHVFVIGPDNVRTWKVKLELTDSSPHAPAQAVSSVTAGTMETFGLREQGRVASFVTVINQADYSKAGPEVMTSLYELVASLEDPNLAAPLAEAYLKRHGNRMTPTAWNMKFALAQTVSRGDPERAATMFRELSAPGGGIDSWKAACAAAEYLDLLIFRLNKGEEAVKQATALLAGRNPKERSLIQSRIGDVYRLEGDGEKAAEAYRRASQAALRDVDGRQAAVLQRARREMALSCLAQRRFPAARDELLQWEAEFPLAKMGSELPVLVGRYFQAVGDDARAAVEFESILKLNPLHPNRPEIAFRLGQSLSRLGKKAAATKWFDEVATKYPNSPFAGEAGRNR